jgi:hypothetical protein
MTLDEMGKHLSRILDCPVTYPAHNKHGFACKCGIFIPAYWLNTFSDSEIIQRHNEMRGSMRT